MPSFTDFVSNHQNISSYDITEHQKKVSISMLGILQSFKNILTCSHKDFIIG